MKYWTRILISIAFIATSFWMEAAHIVGANIQYQCLGGNDYLVTLNVFRNCDDPILLPPSTNVGISFNCSGFDGNHTLTLVSETEVSQLCDDDLPQSSCGSGSGLFPGVTLYRYEGVLTIGNEPGEYRIGWHGSGFRSETINLDNTDNNETLHIYASIFKTANECNNSAILANAWAPYFCLNQQVSFNFGATDPDLDSLSYSFVPAQQNAGFCSADLEYDPGFSGAEPIPGITIDPVTGQIAFIQTNFLPLDAYTVVLRIDEHRGDLLIGSTFIDIQFKVLPCNLPPPVPSNLGIHNFSGTATLDSQQEISMCSGESFCFDYAFVSPVSNAIIEVEDNLSGLFPNSTITTSGSNPITITVCYTAQIDDDGGLLILNVVDDNCPISGISSMSVFVNVSNSLNAGEDQIICPGESAQLQASGDPAVSWETLSGEPIVVGTNFSCINCTNPVATPTSTTTYIATSLTQGVTCVITDTVTVSVGLAVDMTFQSESCEEDDGFITIEVLEGSGNYSLEINNVPIAFDTYHEVNEIDEGVFNINIQDNQSGCEFDTTLTLVPFSVALANAGADATTCALNYTLEAIPSSGVGTWTSVFSNISFTDPADPNTIVTTSSFGDFSLTWTESNGAACNSSDEVIITFVDAPEINAGLDAQNCGLTYQLNAPTTSNDGMWQPTSGIVFGNSTDPSTDITANESGEYPIVWIEDNGFGCVVTDTVIITIIDIPIPDAGPEDQVCSLSKMLEATPSIGIGEWTGSSDLSFNDINDPHADVVSISEGAYFITWTENNQSCLQSDSVEIIFTEMPIASAGSDAIFCGNSIDLNAVPSFGTGTWTSTNPGVDFNNVNSPNSEVIVPDFGDYTFTWTEDNTGGCTNSDQVSFTFLTSPIANAGIGDSICGLASIQLQAIPTTGVGMWSASSNITFSDPDNSITTISASDYGEYEIVWTESDANCSTEDIALVKFFEQPMANAGLDFSVCGTEASLHAIASAGIGTWSGANVDFISDINNPNSPINASDFGTYTFFWTEDNSICTDQDTLVINFLNNGTPFAGEDDSTCVNLYTLNATPTTSGIWIAPELIDAGVLDPLDTSNPNAPLNFQTGSYGTFSLIWFDSTCDEGDEIFITFLETPNTNAGIDFIHCGLETEMNATDASWDGVWILPPGLSSSDNTLYNTNVTATTDGVYDLIWQETNNTCLNKDTVQVEFIHIPEPSVGEDNFTCGLDIGLSVITDGIDGEWNSIGSLSITYTPNVFSTSINVSASDYGSQQFYWSETDPSGNCIGSDTITSVFNTPPDTTNFNIECVNLNTQFQITFDIINGHPSSYEVGGPGTLIGNTFESTLFDTFDSYNFTIDDSFNCDQLVISGSFSCPSLTTAADLSMDTLYICTNETAAVSILEEPFLDANDVALYVIHTSADTILGNLLDENYFAPEFSYINAYTFGTVYYLSSVVGNQLTNGNIDLNDPNLSVSYGVPIIFSPQPEMIVDLDMIEACLDQTAVVDYALNGFPTWELSYTFNDDDILVSDITEVNNNLTFMESGWVHLNSISNLFCTTEINDSIQIIVNANPSAAMEDTYSFCTNEEYLIDVELEGDGPWTFLMLSVENPLSLLDTLVSVSSIQIPVSEGGTYYISNLLDSNCPTADENETTIVEILETPSSMAGEDLEICFGETPNIGVLNQNGLTYQWTNEQWLDNPNAPTPMTTIDVDTNVVIIYEFELTTSNANCDVLDTVAVLVRPLPSNFEIAEIEPYCEGEDVMLNVQGPYDFSWSPSDGLSDPDINNPLVTITESTTYILTAEDIYGCRDSVDVPLSVLSRPDVGISPSTLGGCLPLEVDFQNNTFINTGSSCLWTFTDNDEFISDSCNDISLLFEEEGQYDISLRVIDNNGCIGSATLDTIITASTMDVNFGYSPQEPHVDFPTIQLNSQSPDAINWNWTINNELILDEPFPLIPTDTLGPGSHEVCLQVINLEGCVADICKTIVIDEDPFLWVPSAFTPNSDNTNEVFKPVLSNDYLVETYDFYVYNRLGREIFHTNDINTAWGSNLIKERKRPIGNYIWLVKLKLKNANDPLIYTGSVLILK